MAQTQCKWLGDENRLLAIRHRRPPRPIGILGPKRLRATALVPIVVAAVLAGCASVPERNPLPEAASESAIIAGIPYARLWGDGLPPDWDQQMAERRASLRAEQAELRRRPVALLAISGGGANGAFGAGLLNGWTDAGNRPEFTIVTGISTGALIAPFAFLGRPMIDSSKRSIPKCPPRTS